MFENLRKFIADTVGQPERTSGFADDDYRLATAALLIHVANVDGAIDPPERQRLRQLIEDQFGLDAADTTRLLERAEQSDKEAVDFFHFTNVLKRALDDDGRHKIIEMMWDVVFADGAVTEFEENVVWRIAALLGVSNRDRVMLRQKVADEPHPAPAHEGPWSSAKPNLSAPPGLAGPSAGSPGAAEPMTPKPEPDEL
jgi:uncharacterized tellurite resistance protein B-like protein